MFAEFLTDSGISYESRETNGVVFFIMRGYVIPHGRRASTTIDMAVEIPADFPDTPPYGIHIKTPHELGPANSTNPSSLGEEWEHWSRQMVWNVPSRRTPRYCMDQIHRWLELE